MFTFGLDGLTNIVKTLKIHIWQNTNLTNLKI